MSSERPVAASRPGPLPRLPAAREEVLAGVLDPSRLPTPPVVALQLVQAASRPDCSTKEIVGLLARDPALCGKLLKAVNSCLFGLARPVASLERAVMILGLNPLRSLALGLSLPAMRPAGPADRGLRDFWLQSVGGGIMARELAARTNPTAAEDDLVAGLLRDLGAVLLRRAYPAEWEAATADPDECLTDPCGAEERVFGVSHAEVGAELLRGWNLPADLVEPIRHHHHPDRLPHDHPHADRAEALSLVGYLTRIDEVAQRPELLARVLTAAEDRFGLARDGLVRFLEGVVPKVKEFARVIDRDIGDCPDFAAVLAAGSEELAHLAVENSLSRIGADARPGPDLTHRPGGATLVGFAGRPGAEPAERPGRLPMFRPEFVEDWPAGGCRLDAFELRGLLGRGAMGVVFRAYEPSLDRDVAVKMLAPELAAWPQARQRFAREARVAAAIRHENVVAIHAVRELGGWSYLAMEYVAGGTLQDLLDDDGPPPAGVVARVARQLAAGLAAAHARDIVHRDIKPANVLLESATGRVKLSDFGLARVTGDAQLSRDGSLIGTPLFMSPEQVQGKQATPRSDVFGLGGVLYALCTGRPPFPGEHVAAVLRAVVEDEPEPIGEFRQDIPEWLDKVVMRLLRKNPAQRFASAEELSHVLAGMPDG
ncbi:MAG: HDOD domain-containing protein [Gemmataceae bacterium]|nr:HDOD domain-containing protein [Gemmataceae bacterium]